MHAHRVVLVCVAVASAGYVALETVNCHVLGCRSEGPDFSDKRLQCAKVVACSHCQSTKHWYNGWTGPVATCRDVFGRWPASNVLYESVSPDGGAGRSPAMLYTSPPHELQHLANECRRPGPPGTVPADLVHQIVLVPAQGSPHGGVPPVSISVSRGTFPNLNPPECTNKFRIKTLKAKQGAIAFELRDTATSPASSDISVVLQVNQKFRSMFGAHRGLVCRRLVCKSHPPHMTKPDLTTFTLPPMCALSEAAHEAGRILEARRTHVEEEDEAEAEEQEEVEGEKETGNATDDTDSTNGSDSASINGDDSAQVFDQTRPRKRVATRKQVTFAEEDDDDEADDDDDLDDQETPGEYDFVSLTNEAEADDDE